MTSMARVVNARHEDYDVLIARPSKWGTPFEIGRDGGRERVIRMYETHIRRRPDLLAALPELVGKQHLELCGRGDVWLSHQSANHQLLRTCHLPDRQPRPHGAVRRLWNAGHRADSVLMARAGMELVQTLGLWRIVPDTIVIVLGAFPLLYFLLTTYPRLRKVGESNGPE